MFLKSNNVLLKWEKGEEMKDLNIHSSIREMFELGKKKEIIRRFDGNYLDSKKIFVICILLVEE